MVSRAIDRGIKLPSTGTINLKGRFSNKLSTTITFDKSNTIITNLSPNMTKKSVQNINEFRFLDSNSTPMISTRTNSQEPDHGHDEDHTNRHERGCNSRKLKSGAGTLRFADNPNSGHG
jgi:hypothetical protein